MRVRSFFIFGVAVCICAYLVVAPQTSAATIEELQVQIATLLKQIETLTTQLNALRTLVNSQNNNPATGGGEGLFTHTLTIGSTDATTNGEVTRLQGYLAQNPSIYPEGLITGYFGALTQKAVQRFQAAQGIALSGTPETNGFGLVGPKTREVLNRGGGTGEGIPFLLTPPSAVTIVKPPLGTGVATITIAVAPVAPSAEIVTVFFVSTLPSGVVAGPYATCALPCNAGLGLTVSSAAPVGTYYIKVRAKGITYAGEAGFYLVIASTASGFSYSASAPALTVKKLFVGSVVATNTVALTLISGAAQPVTLSQSGFPAGVTANSASCSPTCTMLNTLTIPASAPTGTFAILVTARASSSVATTSYQLTIVRPDEEQSMFSLSVSRNIAVLQPTSGIVSASNTISLTWQGGAPTPATFTQSGAPQGVSMTVLPSCTPTCSRTNFVTITSAAPTGTYPITVEAANADYATSVTYNVTIVAPADSVPPTVALTKNVASSTIPIGQPVTFTANATDNVKVTKVEFYDGPTLKATDTVSPYTYLWTSTVGEVGAHAWSAKAYDSSGNSAVTGVMIMTVVNPQNPTGSGLHPDVLPLYSGLNWGGVTSATHSDPDATSTIYSGYKVTGTASFSDYEQFLSTYSGIDDYYYPKLFDAGWEYYYSNYFGADFMSYTNAFSKGTSRAILDSTIQSGSSNCPCSIQLSVFTKS